MLRVEDGRDEALAALRRYSLISKNGERISVHRIVQAVTRENLALQEQKAWAGAAVKLLNDQFPEDHLDNVQSWAECSILLPHALAAAGHVEELGVEFGATGRLLNECGLYLQTRGEFTEARKCFERALKIFRDIRGDNHPSTKTVQNNLESLKGQT